MLGKSVKCKSEILSLLENGGTCFGRHSPFFLISVVHRLKYTCI